MNIIITLLLICGLIFFTGGTLGILRFPDFYSRLHPAGKLDTFGLVTTVGSLALYIAFSPRVDFNSLENHFDHCVRLHYQPHGYTCHCRCRCQGRIEAVDKTTCGKGLGMIWQIEIVILIIVIILAVGALCVKDLLGAAILFGAYSFMMCLLWAIMGAVDVAFTEASVGAGVSTVMFVAAVFRTTRRTED